MTKQDWIEVINASGGRDWLDILVIAVSIISPILVVFSVRYAAKSAKAAEEAANLNIKMYNEQKNDQEKTFYPVFDKVGFNEKQNESLTIKLVNRNKAFSITNVEGYMEAEVRWKCEYDYQNNLIDFTIYQNFNEKNTAEFQIWYRALNHNTYKCIVNVGLYGNRLEIINQQNILKY